MTTVRPAHGPILVGIDGSRSATAAARWAAAEARRRRTRLRLVEGVGSMPVPATPDDLEPTFHDVLLPAEQERLAAAATAASQVAPDVAISMELLTGYPIPLLVAESRTAQLVVVGDRGLATITGLLIGSVAAGLAARAACPTIVVRPAQPGGAVPVDGPVVVGVDGSPTSEAALAFAFDAAAARRSPLVAVHAWRDTLIDSSFANTSDWQAVENDEQLVLAERLAGWGAKYPDVSVERVIVQDRPEHALRARSLGAQLLVVGSRGRGGVVGTILGSVSQSVLRHAGCPVAIVRPDIGVPR